MRRVQQDSAHRTRSALVIDPELAATGTVEVTLIVTDTAGFSTTLRLGVRVESHWPRSLTRGWRSTL